jgi:membrane peptidoglycan carboxypeptidase
VLKRITTALATLLRAGVIAGVVVAALTYPLVAVGGLGAKAGADKFNGSVEELRITPPSQVSKVYANDGTTLITQFYEEYRSYTPIDAIAGDMQKAIVAAEDSRFYEHNGVDVRGIARAFVANQQAGGVSQGASTLTMQYVRMALRDSARTPAEVYAATERTPTRKLREMRLALDLEKKLSKQDVLERYLNSAYFGHRAYGIHAAAEVYFSKIPADLSVGEAAMLAGLVQAPSSYDPATSDQAAARERRDYVIQRMADLAYLSAEDAATARHEPIVLRLHEPPNDCVSVPQQVNHWGYFCDFFKSWWMSQPDFGASPLERLDKLRRGGLTIVTTLDPRAQASAQRQVMARQSPRSVPALGLVAVEPGSGRVKAMAVNRVYSLDQSGNGPHSESHKRRVGQRGNYPNTVNPLLGGGDLPGYQAGSTFKMFTMLAALERGMPLSTTINSPKQIQTSYRTGYNDRSACNGNHWCPQNASDSMSGVQTIWSGFGKSVNTFWVQLEQRVGAETAVRMAERLGLRWRTDVDKQQAAPGRANTWGSFTLGVADTTPLEMASSYATVAADGVYCDPLPVASITGLDGVKIDAVPHCKQAVSADVARGALDAARCVTGYGAATGGCGGWATASGVYRMVGRPIAGKSGTTDSNRSAWFIGMTPGLTVASFIADPDNPDHAVGGGINHNKPRDAVALMMRETLSGTPVRTFVSPPPWIVGHASGKAKGKNSKSKRH